MPNASRATTTAASHGPPPAASAAPIVALTVASAWDQAVALSKRSHHLSDEDCDRLYDLERSVLSGVITCRADALAKLRAVAISFDRGELTDGSDADALADVIAWLETH